MLFVFCETWLELVLTFSLQLKQGGFMSDQCQDWHIANAFLLCYISSCLRCVITTHRAEHLAPYADRLLPSVTVLGIDVYFTCQSFFWHNRIYTISKEQNQFNDLIWSCVLKTYSCLLILYHIRCFFDMKSLISPQINQGALRLVLVKEKKIALNYDGGCRYIDEKLLLCNKTNCSISLPIVRLFMNRG